MFSPIGALEKMLFTRELAVLLKSGVTLGEALQSLGEKSGSKNMRVIAEDILHDVENGQTFSHALTRFPKVFDNLYVNLVQVGETSGTLQENLSFLSQQLQESYTLRKKIQSIVLYPLIVLGLALSVGAAVSIFILPRLIRLFESFDVALPLSTRILLGIAGFMEAHGVIFFTLLIAGIILFRVAITFSFFQFYWHRFLLSVPIGGSFFRDIAIAYFCRDMGVMLRSGVPLLEALFIEERVMPNRAFAAYIKSLALAVSQGRSLAEELSRKQYEHISPLAVKMIAAGEKTGRLSETFVYLENFFSSEIDRKIKNMTVLFEPILLFFIGGIVIFLALAILTPIYSLTGSVRR